MIGLLRKFNLEQNGEAKYMGDIIGITVSKFFLKPVSFFLNIWLCLNINIDQSR